MPRPPTQATRSQGDVGPLAWAIGLSYSRRIGADDIPSSNNGGEAINDLQNTVLIARAYIENVCPHGGRSVDHQRQRVRGVVDIHVIAQRRSISESNYARFFLPPQLCHDFRNQVAVSILRSDSI